jgi:hypothetical protein
VLASSFLAACGGDEAVVSPVSITLWSNVPEEPFPVADSDDPEEVNVYAYRGNSPVGSATTDFRDGELRLPTIPFGADNLLAVVLTGDTDAGNNRTIASGGTTVRFSALEGEVIPDLNILTLPPEAFTPAFYVGFDDGDPISEPSVFELGGEGGRAGFTLSTLPDGRLLIAGGATITVAAGVVTLSDFIDSMEIYDPNLGTWFTVTEPGCIEDADTIEECAVRFPSGRAFHTASVMSDGSVVFVGGIEDADDDNYPALGEAWQLVFETPYEGEWIELDWESSVGERAFHTATFIEPDRFIIAGGVGRNYNFPQFHTEVDQIFVDGGDVLLEDAGIALESARALHSAEFFATQVDGGPHGIILAGGRGDGDTVLGSTELIYVFDGELDILEGRPLDQPRFGAATTSYTSPSDTDGDGVPHEYWAVAGGYTAVSATAGLLNGASPTGRIENYVVRNLEFFDDGGDQTVTPARAFASVVHFPLSGDLMLAGGIGADGSVLASGTWVIQQNDGDDGWVEDSTWFSNVSLSGVSFTMSSPRAFAQAVRLPSMFGLFVGGTNGTATQTTSDFFNNNDFSLPFQ